MAYRYIKCPHCGQSDGNDDSILSRQMIGCSYNGEELEIEENRRCDVCGKVYTVRMHYELKYEEDFTLRIP